MKKRENEPNRSKGSYSLEASLSLFLFIVAFLAVVSFINIIKTETAVQYAVDQAAAEISRYCYAADRALGISQGGTADKDEAALGISSLFKGLSSEKPGGGEDAEMIERLFRNAGNTFSSVYRSAGQLTESSGEDGADISSVIEALVCAGAPDAVRGIAGRVAGIALAEMIVPGYLPSGNMYGIHDGKNGINYGLSSVMADGQTVRIVAVYRIDLFGFGLFNRSYSVCQSASTNAWLYEKKDLSAEKENNIWKTDAKKRGAEIVSIFKDENPFYAVNPGSGIDLYNRSSETMISVVSVNVFCRSYSVYVPPENNGEASAGNYRLNEKNLSSEIKSRAQKFEKSVNKVKGKSLAMTTGVNYKCPKEGIEMILKVVLPKEAETEQFLESLKKAAEETERETGVKTEYEFRYCALD